MSLIHDRHGKTSAKRISGTVCVFVGLIMGVCSGFEFYQVSTEMVLTIIGNGVLLLGAGVLEKGPTTESVVTPDDQR